MDPEEVEVKKADKRKWIIGAATVRATRTLSEQSSSFFEEQPPSRVKIRKPFFLESFSTKNYQTYWFHGILVVIYFQNVFLCQRDNHI